MVHRMGWLWRHNPTRTASRATVAGQFDVARTSGRQRRPRVDVIPALMPVQHCSSKDLSQRPKMFRAARRRWTIAQGGAEGGTLGTDEQDSSPGGAKQPLLFSVAPAGLSLVGGLYPGLRLRLYPGLASDGASRLGKARRHKVVSARFVWLRLGYSAGQGSGLPFVECRNSRRRPRVDSQSRNRPGGTSVLTPTLPAGGPRHQRFTKAP
jgi:hypothetical protein